MKTNQRTLYSRLTALSAAFVILLLGLLAPSARAQIHTWELNGNLISGISGHPLGQYGGTLNATNYSFGAGQGLGSYLALPGGDYSIEMVFTLNSIPTYACLLNFSNLTSDAGIYLFNGVPYFAPNGGSPTSPAIQQGVPTKFTVTRVAATKETKIYVNGTLAATRTDSADNYVATGGFLNFFMDNTSGPNTGENAPGSVDRIRIWNYALTPGEVGGPLVPAEVEVYRGAAYTGTQLADNAGNSDLGTVQVGYTGAPQTFTIWNVGSFDLVGISVVKSLPFSNHFDDFNLSWSGPAILPPGNTATFTVAFAPTATGTRSAVLQVLSSDSDEASFEVQVSGTATAAPPFTLTHEYEFSGAFSGVFYDTVGNLNMIQTSGTASNSFHQFTENGGPALNNGLVNPAEYTIEMVFDLASVAGYRALINFDNLSGDNAVFVRDGMLKFYPLPNSPVSNNVVFSDVTMCRFILTRNATTKQVVGYVNGVQVLSATDTNDNYVPVVGGGTYPLRFFSDNSGEAAAGLVDQIRIYDGVMSPGQAASLGGGFAPEIQVSRGGNFIRDNVGTYTLPSVTVGSTGVIQGFTIQNTGRATLSGISVGKSGPNAGDFTITQPTASSLVEGGGVVFFVTFVPSAVGTRNAVITIFSNDADEGSFDINVTATGLLPPPTVTLINPPSGTVAGGEPVTITGTNFVAGSTTVTIGGAAATAVNVTSATSLSCVTPAGAVGARSVVATTPSGPSAANSLFTYFNNTPTISNVTDKVTNEDTATASIAITIGDVETAAGSLSLTATSSNTALVPNANLPIVGSGANRTLVATPAPNQNGTATITLTVTDGGGVTATDTFVLTVNPVNDVPSFAVLPGTIWTARTGLTGGKVIASSTDGTKLAAAEFGGQIYTSTNSGLTWTARESVRDWNAIASSADGTKLVAAAYNGKLYTSTDSGVTWTARLTDANRGWYSITSSANGSKLAAVAYNGKLYTSTDSGVTWTARMTDADRQWTSITCSTDGTKLAATTYFHGIIYTSTDSGVTWTERATDAYRFWRGITSSSDGSKLAAVALNDQIYTSTDSGVTWTARAAALEWSSIASSADGSKLVAAVEYGQIYISTDSGLSWTARESERGWTSVASSADGSKLAAVCGQVYTSSPADIGIAVDGPGISTIPAFASGISPGPADEAGQSVTFNVTNSNNALFTTQPAIAGNGTLTFTAGSVAGSATVSVVAQDTGGTANGGVNTSAAQTFTISITNSVPTGITLSAASVQENVAANSIVGTLSATDPDAGNTFAYYLVFGPGGTDNAAFNISGATLRILASPDFETKSSYSIRVVAVDQGGLEFAQTFTITVSDLNEPSMTLSGNGVSIANNDTTPSPADHTAFGSVSVNAATVQRTFTIGNGGPNALALTGAPRVTVSGTHAADFSVSAQPAAGVNAGATTTFSVVFNPSATGMRQATLTILNDDPARSPFTFAIQGTGLSDDANLSNITISPGTLAPAFNPAVTTYAVTLPNTTTSTVIGATGHPAATITVNGAAPGSTIQLAVGLNAIPIVVIAEDGSTKTYTVNVTRQGIAPQFNTTTGALVIGSQAAVNPVQMEMKLVVDGGIQYLEITDPGNPLGSAPGVTSVGLNTIRVPLSSVTSLVITGSPNADSLTLDFSNGDFSPAGGIVVNGGLPATSPGDELIINSGQFTDGKYETNGVGSGTVDLEMLGIPLNGTITFTGLEPLDFSGSTFVDFTVVVDADHVTPNKIVTTVSAVDAGLNTEVTFTEGLESVKLGPVTGSLTIQGDDLDSDYISLNGLGSAMTGDFSVDGLGGDSDVIVLNNATFTVAGLNKNLSLKADFIGIGREGVAAPNDLPGVIVCSGNITLEADGDSSIASPLLWGTGGVWNSTTPTYFNNALATNTNLARGTIQMRGDIRKTAGNDATLTLKARGAVVFPNSGTAADTGKIISTNNKLHVVMQSDSDSVNAGSILLQQRATITTNGGDLTIGGGANPLTSPANGIAGNTTIASGVNIVSTAITTGGGNVSIRGQGGANNNATGVVFNCFSGTVECVLNSGSGNIAINGVGGGGTFTTTPGVFLIGNGVLPARVRSSSGNITINGTAQSTSTTTTSGVQLSNASEVSASGAGNITITGSAATAVSAANADIGMTAATGTTASISSAGGNITLVGDSMNLSGGVGTKLLSTSGSGLLKVKTRTAGKAINVGAADSASQLGLVAAELDILTASTVQIGDATSGTITVSAIVAPLNFKTLALGNNTAFASTGGFASDVTSAAVYEKMTVAGTVNIAAGAAFSTAPAGGYVWNGVDIFTFLANDAADAIVGSFTGPTLTNWLGSTLTATQNYSGGTGNDFSIGSSLTAIESWRLLYFGSSANAGNGAGAFDFDKDGVANVVEFAFGLNPTISASMQLPQPARIGNDFVLTFTQPGGVSGITYGAEWSTTLQPGSWTPIADTGTGGTHTFSVPIGTNNRMFMRIVVTEP